MPRAASEDRNFPVTEVWVADYLQLSRSTVQKWRMQGIGPPYVKLGKSVRYLPEDVESWLKTKQRLNRTLIPFG